MLPPNETLKDVLHYADYRTLVRAKFAAARFLHLINKYAEEFACRRSFRIWIGNTDRVGSCIIYQDAATGAPARMIPFKFKNLQSLAPACRELDAVVGFHAVEQLTFSDYTWNTPGFGGVVFEAVPMLKYAEAVELRSPLSVTSRGYSDVFAGNFMGLKELHLSLEDEGLRYFDWAFLRRESARALRLVKFTVNFWSVNTDHYAEDLVRHCVTHPRPHGAEALELDFSHDFMHPTFGRHIIEVLKGSGCELIFRMQTREKDLGLDNGDYTVHVDGTSKRYASDEGGIVVEVDGPVVTIRSTAVVPCKKPRAS